MDEWIKLEHFGRALPLQQKSTIQTFNAAATLYSAMASGAISRMLKSDSCMFYVDLGKEPAYSTFVQNLAPELRQVHQCSACRKFANYYGALALVQDDGTLQPLLWSIGDMKEGSDMIKKYAPAVRALQDRFKDCKVTTQFKAVQKKTVFGVHDSSGFNHMFLKIPDSRVGKTEIAGFKSANTRGLATMLQGILDDYDIDTFRKVNTILANDQLPYASNHKASAKWLVNLVEQTQIEKTKDGTSHHNLLYRYAADRFVGSLTQMRSGPLSKLLGYVKENRAWNDILADWNGLCNPVQYMRPQAPPGEGNVRAAERLFEQLSITKEDLRRRLLVQEDVPKDVIMWASERMKRKNESKQSSGVFAGVKTKPKSVKAPPTTDIPPIKMTFSKFVTRILPKAKHVECWLGDRDSITTLVTGLPGSKPLMQWHDRGGKNLASQYCWIPSQPVTSHSLKKQAWNEVRCLIPLPYLWDGVPLTTTFPLVDPDGPEGGGYMYYHKQKGFRYLFVLEENRETNLKVATLFPTYLKSEFHGVRSTIEGFNRTASLEDVPDAHDKGGYVAGVEHTLNDEKRKYRVTNLDGIVTEFEVIMFE